MPASDLVARIKNAPDISGFVLDFDGTLSAVVAERQRAAPIEGAVDVLESLASKYKSVVLVSGRRAEDLIEIVGAEGVEYVGVWGAEKIVDGRLVQPSQADGWRGMASRLTRDAEALIHSEGLFGCEVEYKDLALSIHYRNAGDPGEARDVLQSWAEVSASKRGFETHVGRMVLELRPIGVSKGHALRQIVSEHGLQNVVTAGDDSSDLEALQKAKEMLGESALTIGLRSSEQPEGLDEISDLLIDSPAELLDLLKQFL